MTDNQQTNLIVNYLPQTMTDEEFRHLFMTIGPVKASKIVRHKATGYSYGFGFVEYVEPSDADAAIESLNGYQIQNKKLKVAYARPRSEHIKHANLYIRGIPKKISQQEIESKFGECGTIIQCTVLKDEATNTNKGVAFVLFDLKEQADAAIEKFNGLTLPGGTEPLSVKFAEDNSKKVLPIVQYQMAAGLRRGRAQCDLHLCITDFGLTLWPILPVFHQHPVDMCCLFITLVLILMKRLFSICFSHMGKLLRQTLYVTLTLSKAKVMAL